VECSNTRIFGQGESVKRAFRRWGYLGFEGWPFSACAGWLRILSVLGFVVVMLTWRTRSLRWGVRPFAHASGDAGAMQEERKSQKGSESFHGPYCCSVAGTAARKASLIPVSDLLPGRGCDILNA
jgi:hypothetical protein